LKTCTTNREDERKTNKSRAIVLTTSGVKDMPIYRVTETWVDRRTTEYEANKVFVATSENDAREMAAKDFDGHRSLKALGWTVKAEDIHNDEDCFDTNVEEMTNPDSVDAGLSARQLPPSPRHGRPDSRD
jgi:hypothetical protein